MKEGNMTSKNKEIPLHVRFYTLNLTLAVPDYGVGPCDPMLFLEIADEAVLLGYEEQERSIS